MIASDEYKRWLFNPRIIMLLAALFPLYDLVVKPLDRAAKEMGQPLNILEPIIAIMNSWVCVMTITIVFIVLISPFPSLKGNALFSIARMGKVNWIFGEMVFQFLACVSYVVMIIAFMMIQYANKAFLANGWSLVVSDYDNTVNDVSEKIVGTLIPLNIANQMPPYKAFGMSVLMFLMLLIIICTVLLLGCMYYKRLIFFCTLIIYIIAGCGMFMINTNIKWLFLMPHINLAQHFTMYFREYIFSPYASFGITVALTMVSVIMIFIRLKKVNIDMISYWW